MSHVRIRTLTELHIGKMHSYRPWKRLDYLTVSLSALLFHIDSSACCIIFQVNLSTYATLKWQLFGTLQSMIYYSKHSAILQKETFLALEIKMLLSVHRNNHIIFKSQKAQISTIEFNEHYTCMFFCRET